MTDELFSLLVQQTERQFLRDADPIANEHQNRIATWNNETSAKGAYASGGRIAKIIEWLVEWECRRTRLYVDTHLRVLEEAGIRLDEDRASWLRQRIDQMVDARADGVRLQIQQESLQFDHRSNFPELDRGLSKAKAEATREIAIAVDRVRLAAMKSSAAQLAFVESEPYRAWYINAEEYACWKAGEKSTVRRNGAENIRIFVKEDSGTRITGYVLLREKNWQHAGRYDCQRFSWWTDHKDQKDGYFLVNEGLLFKLVSMQPLDTRTVIHLSLANDVQVSTPQTAAGAASVGDTDHVTGLLARSALEAAFELAWTECSQDSNPLSVLMIDLDHFKAVNDTHGSHAQGDEILRESGTLLRRIVGRRGSVGRYGGDELQVILPGTTSQEAAAVGERIRNTFETQEFTRVAGSGPPLRQTVSIGVAAYPEHSIVGSELRNVADKSLYEAKKTRNRVVVAGSVEVPTLNGE